MNKIYSSAPSRIHAYLLLVAYLLVQGFVIEHMAKNGFCDHKHGGRVCGAYLYCEQGQAGGGLSSIILRIASMVTESVGGYPTLIYLMPFYSDLRARAPPLLLS